MSDWHVVCRRWDEALTEDERKRVHAVLHAAGWNGPGVAPIAFIQACSFVAAGKDLPREVEVTQ